MIRVIIPKRTNIWTGVSGQFLGSDRCEHMVWYVLFIIFATYAMLPLPLRWSLGAAASTALLQLVAFAVIQHLLPDGHPSPYQVTWPASNSFRRPT